ncbi:SDR family NAD(P)-dependent oxidoreductase [Streptosporangium sp. 'caverna']|uniref:SDR family NAD(P)-dependent oxidoreductase n=1 Tax=Streptosporangium sp. 'caverna' TaxID=2202249 RepID=UPI000D7E1E55|nr:SDR family NAD(P)-dependent oxidoreductase [Streptosporangium sp. 'caverna']AWS46540.1 hypothetical protein DKM19_39820 [Streptosporangium sp. 'caverna']
MSVAIVGLACTYPDAPDPGALWETVLWRRRAFRRMPVERLDLADYHSSDRLASDHTYSTRAALIEGWEFDRAAFRIPGAAHRAGDPAHWLALEVASRALIDAGFPGGKGLDRDRVTVVMGNTLTGEVSRASTLRLRWPYVRRVLVSALAGLPEETVTRVLSRARGEYLRPFPETSEESLAGSLPGTIAGRVCDHFDLRGGGYVVDGAGASSLLAVITACRSLLDGSADFALAGGVDLSLDPFELVGLAKTGALAEERMRIYDTRSNGFWPGEGCGIVALMPTAGARAAGVRIYAEIAGWGVSSDGGGGMTRPESGHGGGGMTRPESDGRLLALRRAYAQAGISPTEVALFEGHGIGTAVGDTAELTALTRLLSGTVRQAALGSVAANIGHTKAAAGAAGLIKATLSIASGVLPPTTGCGSPHSLLTAPGAPLRVLAVPEPWPSGPRHAGVSATGFGDIHAHLVLTAPAPAEVSNLTDPVRPAPDRPSPDEPLVFAFSGEDAEAVRPVLERVADQAVRWSEAELCDLAHALGTAPAGSLRIAIVAGSAEQLSERAELALKRLDTLEPGSLVALSGLYLGQDVKGRVTLLFPSQEAPAGDVFVDRPMPDTASAETAAALWADTAIQDLTDLYGDHPARPVDIWRDRVFIPSPCSSAQVTGAIGERTGGGHGLGGGIAGIVMGLVAGVISRLPSADTPEPAGRAGPVAGVAHWVRCFAEDPDTGRDVPAVAADGGADSDWETDGPKDTDIPVRRIVIDDPLRPGAAESLVSAAREAVARRERLAVVCGSDAVAGFLGSLRLEHPELDFGAGEPRGRTVIALDGEGPLPVGPADVVLVSGGGKGIGFACARALAEASGCALALLGHRRPNHDPILRTNLQMLAVKGVRYGYATADVGDADQVTHAVRELEGTLGPATMLIHSAEVNRPGRFAELTAEDFERHIAPRLTGLDNLLAVTAPRRVVTFGSVIGLYGLAGESHYALAGGLMRERVRRIGGLNIDWSVWSGAGMGERLGVLESLVRAEVTAIPAREGVELFLNLLRTKDLPSSVAVHGRLGGPAAPCPGGGRFLEGTRVHVPGVELVADSRLSIESDVYLNDHRMDGQAVLPSVVALEAMAQAAGALAGRPLDEAAEITFDRPVVVPDEGGTTIRVCALRHEQTVEAVVRSEETGFHVDHFRAVFPVNPVGETLFVPQLNRDGTEPLDAEDLYGALCFHTGRFQRVRELTLVEARSCRGELRGDDPDGWFPDRPVLGSPGLSDATIHALQACVPHRRLLPVGCERLVMRPSQGDVRLHATERGHDRGEYVWDVTTTDVRGRLVAAWIGLRLKDVGPLPRRDPWPTNLLAVYLQRAAVGLGLDPALHVTMAGGTCRSHLDDLVLGVNGPAYCDWERVGGAGRTLGPAFDPLVAELLPRCAETEEIVSARIWTAVECLSKAGRPPTTPLVVVGGYEEGWLLLRAGTGLIASTVVRVRDVREPVAVSIMTERS